MNKFVNKSTPLVVNWVGLKTDNTLSERNIENKGLILKPVFKEQCFKIN